MNDSEKGTLCWTCQNAVGGCSWSKTFDPVDGWKAVRTARRNYGSSLNPNLTKPNYYVLECPEYTEDTGEGFEKWKESLMTRL